MADEQKPPHRYRITYKFQHHPDGVTEEAIAEGWGGTDSLFAVSIMGRPGKPEPLSLAFLSRDGFTGQPLTPSDVFQIWAMLASVLAESPELPPGKRTMCSYVDAAIREIMRGGNDSPDRSS
jgi:hypothetical protein